MHFHSLAFLHLCETSLLLLREVPFLFHLFLPNSHFHHTVAKRQMIKSPTHSSFSTLGSGFGGLNLCGFQGAEGRERSGLPCSAVTSSSLFPVEFRFFPEHSYLVSLTGQWIEPFLLTIIFVGS